MKSETCKLFHDMEAIFWSETRASIGDHSRMEAVLAVIAGRLAAEGFTDAANYLADQVIGRGHG